MPPTQQTASRRSPTTPSTTRPSLPGVRRVRAGIQQMFSGRSSVGTHSSPPDSPKTPRLPLGPENMASTRLAIPYLSGTATEPPPHSSHRSSQPASQPRAAYAPQQQLDYSNISALSLQTSRSSTRRFVDPAEQQLAELVSEGRRRRQKTPEVRKRCFPKVKSKRTRSKLLTCVVSGLILLAVLAIYLALILTPHSVDQEFRILLILILLVAAVIFCHSLIRVVIAILNPRKQQDLELQLPQMASAGGYANPEAPIRVVLARDEEAAGIQRKATKFPPPAYGLWRESVRVDPNRLFWQRNEASAEGQDSRTDRPHTANRPPSYISEDGVNYVLEVQPRLITPGDGIPLPPHPSELNRLPAA